MLVLQQGQVKGCNKACSMVLEDVKEIQTPRAQEQEVIQASQQGSLHLQHGPAGVCCGTHSPPTSKVGPSSLPENPRLALPRPAQRN